MEKRKITYREAVNQALHEEMERDEKVICFGEDVASYQGVFKVTEGLLSKFGNDRCFDTPIAESAIVGTAVGAAVTGLRPVIEIMFMDWIGLTVDCLVNQASMMHYLWDGAVTVPMVLRTQGGAGSSGCCHHTKSMEAWLYHIPHMKIVMPSTPYDAKGLLKASIRDNNPVVFIEQKLLYATTGEVPADEYLIDIGTADVKKEGSDVTIVAISKMVQEALEASNELEKEGISSEVVDPRTLKPLDMETIGNSVRKTGKVLIVNEAFRTGSVASDIGIQIQEECFDYLDAPILRVTAPDVQPPYAKSLENLWLPGKDTIKEKVKELVSK